MLLFRVVINNGNEYKYSKKSILNRVKLNAPYLRNVNMDPPFHSYSMFFSMIHRSQEYTF